MTIKEMHELFRVLGQQMGMQKVRGILPESIDILLNTSIVHCVRQIITSNVTTNFGNIVATQRNKISVINALRTLYVEDTQELEYDGESIPYPIEASLFYGFKVFSIINCDVAYDEEEPYKYISTRLIEPNLIAEVERDYLLKPTPKFPVATIVETVDDYIYETTGENNTSTSITGTLIKYNFYTDGTKATKVKASFLKYPAKVHYSDDAEQCVDCDLPIHLHHMIVEEAVRLYFQSVNLTSGSSNDESQQNNKNNRQ